MAQNLKLALKERKEFGKEAHEYSMIGDFKIIVPIIDTIFMKQDEVKIIRQARSFLSDYIVDITCYKNEVHLNCYYGEGIPVENIKQIYEVIGLINKVIVTNLGKAQIYNYETIVEVSTVNSMVA
ncbi:hypothetical protein [Vallitalea okinawensis]|uniref:hypothetical protein n=1 Tax=Vallitalea okinawensis TaxID=2078660 RepID=UPI000CFDABB8|nr:hypothetical protein [Vallitalea okinawensis]